MNRRLAYRHYGDYGHVWHQMRIKNINAIYFFDLLSTTHPEWVHDPILCHDPPVENHCCKPVLPYCVVVLRRRLQLKGHPALRRLVFRPDLDSCSTFIWAGTPMILQIRKGANCCLLESIRRGWQTDDTREEHLSTGEVRLSRQARGDSRSLCCYRLVAFTSYTGSKLASVQVNVGTGDGN